MSNMSTRQRENHTEKSNNIAMLPESHIFKARGVILSFRGEGNI